MQEQVLLDKDLHSLGVRFNHQHFVNEYGLKADEFTLAENQEQFSSPENSSASFSVFSNKVQKEHKEAVRHQLAFDSALKELLPEALQANQKFLDELLQAVNNAADFEELEYALIEFLGSQMEMSDLEDFLARALTKAELFGMYAAEKEQPKQGDK